MATLPKSILGRTGLTVTKLGYGAMELRGTDHFPRLSPTEASIILNGVLDSGINYLDTSPDYGYSEEMIGTHLAHRRGEFFLASKCGCPVEPVEVPHASRKPHSFTRQNIRAGVEQSLARLRTDYLDVVQFHISPSRAVLEQHDSVGFSTSSRYRIRWFRDLVVKDESVIDDYPEFLRAGFRARRRHWRETEVRDLLGDMTPMEFMLRFTISNPDMATTIVGTANPAHLQDNVRAAAQGPLPHDVYETARKRFD